MLQRRLGVDDIADARPLKRARASIDIVPYIVNRHLPCSTALRALAEDVEVRDNNRLSEKTLQNHATEELHRLRKRETIYGPVSSTIEIAGTQGNLSVTFLDPRAMLYVMAEERPEFGSFITSVLNGGMGHVVLFVDTTKPGNCLRPDKGRSFEGIYWTILEFPHWFRRSHTRAWFSCAYVLSSAMSDAGVSISVLMAAFLRIFWLGDSCLRSVGVRLPSLGGPAHIRLAFGFILGDEKGLWECMSTRGSQATKPCFHCKNIIGRRDPTEDFGEYLIHFSDTRHEKFDFHSRESYEEMAHMLATARDNGTSNAEFDRMQQLLGLTYEPGGIMFSKELRDLVDGPNGFYHDWNHNLTASGGLAQLHVNEFLRHIVREGISLARLDEFASTVVFPHTYPKLGRNFFSTRYVNKDDACLRAFASETIGVVSILGIFCDSVLRPTGSLTDHCECLDRLRIILDILLLADAGVAFLAALETAANEYRTMYARLYYKKPKLHYFFHVIQCIARYRRILCCNQGERKHRFAKGIASHCYSYLSQCMLAHALNEHVRVLKSPDALKPYHLEGKPKEIRGADELFGSASVPWKTFASISLQTPKGHIHKRDVVVWRTAKKELRAGQVEKCLRAEFGRTISFFILLQDFSFLSGAVWSKQGSTQILVPAGLVLRTVMYQNMGETVRLALPRVLL